MAADMTGYLQAKAVADGLLQNTINNKSATAAQIKTARIAYYTTLAQAEATYDVQNGALHALDAIGGPGTSGSVTVNHKGLTGHPN
jgi:hypothetical protein